MPPCCTKPRLAFYLCLIKKQHIQGTVCTIQQGCIRNLGVETRWKPMVLRTIYSSLQCIGCPGTWPWPSNHLLTNGTVPARTHVSNGARCMLIAQTASRVMWRLVRGFRVPSCWCRVTKTLWQSSTVMLVSSPIGRAKRDNRASPFYSMKADVGREEWYRDNVRSAKCKAPCNHRLCAVGTTPESRKAKPSGTAPCITGTRCTVVPRTFTHYNTKTK